MITTYFESFADMEPIEFAEEIVSLVEGFGWNSSNGDSRQRALERILFYLETTDGDQTNFEWFMELSQDEMANELADAVGGFSEMPRDEILAEIQAMLSS